VIDGVDISPVLFTGSGGRQPLFFYYSNEEVWGVRRGPWKLHRKTMNPGATGKWGQWPTTEHNPPLLFNVETDPGEKYNVAADHPELLSALSALIDEHRAQIQPGPPQR
jgi:arylsulfatase A-like enzyme